MGTKYKAEITEEIKTKDEWRLFLDDVKSRLDNTRVNIGMPVKVKIEVEEVDKNE